MAAVSNEILPRLVVVGPPADRPRVQSFAIALDHKKSPGSVGATDGSHAWAGIWRRAMRYEAIRRRTSELDRTGPDRTEPNRTHRTEPYRTKTSALRFEFVWHRHQSPPPLITYFPPPPTRHAPRYAWPWTRPFLTGTPAREKRVASAINKTQTKNAEDTGSVD